MTPERKTVMVSVRLPATLVARADFVTRNTDGEIKNRSAALYAALDNVATGSKSNDWKNLASSRKKVAKKRVPKTIKNNETCLQMHCKQWLDKSGIWNRLLIFHVANERKGGFGVHMHFKRMGVRKGVADWLAFPPAGPLR